MALFVSFRKTPPLGVFLLALSLFIPFSAKAQEPASTGYINNQNAPIGSILDIYEQLSGKRLIRDANLNNVPGMSINATGLNKEETLKLIESTLLLNGVAIVPVDDHTVKIVTVNQKNPRSEGLHLYTKLEDLPPDDEVVSYYMPLDYITGQEAQVIFTQIAPIHAYGAYVIAPSAQGVVITESTSVIRQLVALKELIDVPPAKVETQFVQLERADADKVADTLNKLLNPTTGPPSAAGGGGAGSGIIVPASLGNDEPLSNERNLVSGSVQIVSDTRSNQLLVISRPGNMPFLMRLISEMDKTNTFAKPQSFPLMYVLAQDILPALEEALAQGKDEEDEVQKEAAASSHSSTQTQTSGTSATNVNNAGANGGSNAGAVTPDLTAPTQNDVPTVVTIGKTRLIADNRANSIIVFGSDDAAARVHAMIAQLDVKPLQVSLATVIGELTVSEGFEFGIDILQNFQRIGSGGLASSNIVGSNTTTSAAVPNPTSLLTSTGFPIASGLTLYGAIGSTINAYVRALDTTNRFKVISRPVLYTSNNKLAVIDSGSDIPVPSNTTSGFTGGTDLTTTSNITYQDVLLKLEIIPMINAQHQVTLKIHQTNNSVGASQVISGNSIPTILTQEINTEVTVPDKSTIVIGGLISDTSKRNTTGVPWLSDIPLLGYLFKDTQKSKERDELIIMIQPTVIDTDADQLAVNEAEKRRTILGREAIEATQGDLPTSTTTTTTTTTLPAGPVLPANAKGMPAVRTDSTTITVSPPAGGTSIVPAASSPAPDVGKGIPPDAPAVPSPTTMP